MSELEELQEINNKLYHRVVTLEVILDSLYSELIDSKILNEVSFNERVADRIKSINDEFENTQKLVDTINTLNIFMGNTHGEA
jgi:hypothetical protein